MFFFSVLVLFAFVVLCFVSSVVSHEIGWENSSEMIYLFCVEWDVQEDQHPLTGQRAANFRLLANQ